MVKRAAATLLPDEVKAWLDEALVESNFSGYEALADELRERGYTISKSSLQRYGSAFERSLAAIKLATEQARAVAEAMPDDENALSESLLRLVQQKAFETLVNMEEAPATLAQLGKIAAETGGTSVAVKKYRTEVRRRAEAAAAHVAKVARKAGASDETIEQLKQRILGVAGG